jgi:vitamin B12 transporter
MPLKAAPWVSGFILAAASGRAAAQDAVQPETPEVTIHGESIERPPKDSGVAGSVIRGESLHGAGLRASEALRNQPGVQVVETGGLGAPATASLRGATAADTPVYLAGIRLNDDVGGTADLSLVPLWLIDRVEIYRGNAPIEADRLGPGGAIFFEPRLPQRTTAGVGGMLGSFGAKNGFAYAGLKTGPVASLVGVSAEAADNDYSYLNDHGTLLDRSRDSVDRRTNADASSVDGWGLARIDLGGAARADLLVNAIRREQGVPSLALLPTRAAREETERALVSLSTSVPFGRSGEHVLESKTSAIASRTSFHDPLYELFLQATDLVVSARRLEQSLSANLELNSAVRLRPATTFSYERIRRDPDDIPLDRAHRAFARAATTLEADVSSNFILRLLASGECHDTHGDDARVCDLLLPSGRIGAELDLPHVALLANVGRYARVPTLGELYGVSGVIRGNPGLNPEQGFTAEVGVRAQIGRPAALGGLAIDAFAYLRAADDLIAYLRAAQGYVAPYNVGAARVIGAEAAIVAPIFSFLRFETSITLQDPRDTSAARTTVNDILPFRSRLIFTPRLTAGTTFDEASVLRYLGGTASFTYQSSRYVDPAGLGVVAEQGSLDLMADAKWFGEHLTTRVRVSDVLDAPRTDVIGFPLPGRSAYVSSRWRRRIVTSQRRLRRRGARASMSRMRVPTKRE